MPFANSVKSFFYVTRHWTQQSQPNSFLTLFSYLSFSLFSAVYLFFFLFFVLSSVFFYSSFDYFRALFFPPLQSNYLITLSAPRKTKPTGGHRIMESHDETDRPILCINNCGFFGRAATMNMCSKCYKDTLLKQEHDKLAAASVENIVNGGSDQKQAVTDVAVDVQVRNVEVKTVCAEISGDSSSSENLETKIMTGPNKCATCRKRIGLTGFSCKCGNHFCAIHRYPDKHDCSFDFQTVGRNAIAKANPVIKADKLDKI